MKLKTIIATLLLAAGSTAAAQKYVGGDISLLPKYEGAGAKYLAHDGTAIGSPLAFFKEQGMNAMRVRLFVDPSKQTGEDLDPNASQTLDDVTALGKRIKDAGLKLMLDIHYSDTWADPGKQWTPDAWAPLTDGELKTKVHDYTVEVLKHLMAAGATPDFIQTGNEISYGMLWGTRAAVGAGDANRCYPSSPEANWTRFTALLAEAGKACRETCPGAKIIVHTERTSVSQQADNKDYAALKNFYAKIKAAGVDYDIIGLSYYPYFHGAISELEGAVSHLEATYPDKQIMVVEVGYPSQWAVPGTTYDYTSTYPYTDEGQRQFTADLVAMLNKHDKVTGLFWWWMEYNAYGTSLSGWYNAPLFNSLTGCATSALYELRGFAPDASGICAAKATAPKADTWHTLGGLRTDAPTKGGVYVNNGRKVAVR